MMAKKKSESAKRKTVGGKAASEEPYVVLARKYRPQTFDDLIGQEAMVQTVRNAFASGRIAQAYMLTGVRGVGKTTTARILARALNYSRDGAPEQPTIDMTEPGRHCAEIMESRHPDVIEMDAASNTGVDNIRELIESARYKPLIARTKVFIIDEVHMLSKGAFNALLKTLEEPPEHVKFIFATTEIRKVPVTVLSRCQRFDLRRVDVPELTAHFKKIVAEERAKAADDALTIIARAAEGSVRDGLSLLDQAIAMGQGQVSVETVRAMLGLADRGRIFDLLEHLFRGDTKAALVALDGLHQAGAEPGQILSDLAEAVHAAARCKAVGPEAGSEGLSAEEKRRAQSLAERLSTPLLSRAWQMLLKGWEETARAPNTRAAAEMVLIRLAHTADLPAPDEVIRSLGGPGALAQAGAKVSRGDNGSTSELPLGSAAPGPSAGLSGADVFDEPSQTDDDGQLISVDDDEAAGGPPDPSSFSEVIALVGARRDAKLKVHLEEHVSLVKFDAAAGSIDLFLLPGGPSQIANELREKLNAWTRRRWVVMLSKAAGERPIGEVRREREAAELEALKAHPAVKAVLDEFPDAEIADVRPLVRPSEDETGTG
ncbi:MAG: DNA polymerase III subunit gamma/tau [Hyphomicrobium sp.]